VQYVVNYLYLTTYCTTEACMNRKQQILQLADASGIIRAKDAEMAGISRNYLYEMHREGLLEKISTGLYTLPDTPVTENSTMAEVSKRIPHAVASLISALIYHGLTTQLSPDIWLTVPKSSRKPKIKYPPLNLTYVSGTAYSFGIQKHIINGVSVKIYSPAKTVADCFKFRSKVGLDVAIEALHNARHSRKATMDELMEAAKVDRVLKIMNPYMEAIV
jgi:predicted transcriptional regulator of viral defense system